MVPDFNNGLCSFVGDWKTLKHKGFKYYNHNSIVYMYHGINNEHQYSSMHIRKSLGIVSFNQLTGCLYQVLTFIRDELEGKTPRKLYIQKDKSRVSLDNNFPFDYQLIFVEEGLDVLYRLFLDGDIVHNPDLYL